MLSRRHFLGGSALIGATLVSGRTQAAAIPEAPTTDQTSMQPPIPPEAGQDYQPVVTLNGWTLPWRMNGD
jgi:L-ascorbate oxidase